MAISSSLSEAEGAIRRHLEALPAGYWDFSTADTKELTHGYHSYPAMMIPQVARSLIGIVRSYEPQMESLFDPFMGSGTSLVEGLVAGMRVSGSDLNPLSRLIAQVKTTTFEPDELVDAQRKVGRFVSECRITESDWPDFDHLTFWFKPEVISALTRLKRAIQTVVPDAVRPFFWVSFSDTVRWVSNSRNGEFKLYRLDEPRLAQWNPDVWAVFQKIVARNQLGNAELWGRRPLPRSAVYAANAMDLSLFPDHQFDLMLTSPPYGDSRTTVAYGQFSRLSLQWLNLADAAGAPAPNKLDQAMLGGVASRNLAHQLPSPTLNQALSQIAERDIARARQVLSFYTDLHCALSEIARVLRPGGYQCWVVGSRTVKAVQLRTDHIIRELSEPLGLRPVADVLRAIPMKRMPKENSPTNRVGAKSATMNGEQIFILKKAR